MNFIAAIKWYFNFKQCAIFFFLFHSDGNDSDSSHMHALSLAPSRCCRTVRALLNVRIILHTTATLYGTNLTENDARNHWNRQRYKYYCCCYCRICLLFEHFSVYLIWNCQDMHSFCTRFIIQLATTECTAQYISVLCLARPFVQHYNLHSGNINCPSNLQSNWIKCARLIDITLDHISMMVCCVLFASVCAYTRRCLFTWHLYNLWNFIEHFA